MSLDPVVTYTLLAVVVSTVLYITVYYVHGYILGGFKQFAYDWVEGIDKHGRTYIQKVPVAK